MWDCPRCGSKVDPSFEVCWACGTTPDGVEDPSFVTADDSGPIDDPEDGLKDAPALQSELPEPPLELVLGYKPYDLAEAKFLENQLADRGIPASVDGTHMSTIEYPVSIFGPRVMVRAQDLPRAQAFFEEYEDLRKARAARDDE